MIFIFDSRILKSLLIMGLILSAFSGVGMASASPQLIGGYFEPGGMYGGHAGYHYWLNYCPLCHNYGCLLKNPKGTAEGELTCSVCDADYDGCTGADKSGGGARAWLKHAVKAQTKTQSNQAQNNTTAQPQKQVAVQKPVDPTFHTKLLGNHVTVQKSLVDWVMVKNVLFS